MSLIELKYLAEKLPPAWNSQDICDLVDIGQSYTDENGKHNVFDGEDERTDFLVFLLTLAESYAHYLSVKGQTQEHDYWKDGLLAYATTCSMEGWNYYNSSFRIREVIQEINRNNSYITDYYFSKYQPEIEGEDSK
jgi:hypothetical protein